VQKSTNLKLPFGILLAHPFRFPRSQIRSRLHHNHCFLASPVVRTGFPSAILAPVALLSFDGTSHLHCSSSLLAHSPSHPGASDSTINLTAARFLRTPRALRRYPRPTQWKRQFLNFFGCPGAATIPLSEASVAVASRRPLEPTTSAARASSALGSLGHTPLGSLPPLVFPLLRGPPVSAR
jgi:hypothetical protein